MKNNCIYHKQAIPIFLIAVNILWIFNIFYFFTTKNLNMELFREKYKIFSIIIYLFVVLISIFGSLYEFFLVKERRRYYQPFYEIKQELTSINEENNKI